MYIKNCRNSSKIKYYSPIEHCGKMENLCFEVSNFSYTQRSSKSLRDPDERSDRQSRCTALKENSMIL